MKWLITTLNFGLTLQFPIGCLPSKYKTHRTARMAGPRSRRGAGARA